MAETDAFPRLLGKRLCLDFVNTVEDPFGDEREDFLGDYDDLVGWSEYVDVLDESAASRLRTLALDEPGRAREVFERAIALRDSIERVFRRIAAGAEPPDDDLAAIQAEHLAALRAASLGRSDAGYAWSWKPDDDLFGPLWPVVESAIEVLAAGDPARVKQCPGADDCGWLFYDTSRNGTRRWCSMEGCGSRVKMRRHYARRKSSRPRR